MRYAKWPHYPHGHITHLSPTIFIFTNTNNLFLCSNILQLKYLITYKHIVFMHDVHLKKCQAEYNYYFIDIIIDTKIF